MVNVALNHKEKVLLYCIVQNVHHILTAVHYLYVYVFISLRTQRILFKLEMGASELFTLVLSQNSKKFQRYIPRYPEEVCTTILIIITITTGFFRMSSSNNLSIPCAARAIAFPFSKYQIKYLSITNLQCLSSLSNFSNWFPKFLFVFWPLIQLSLIHSLYSAIGINLSPAEWIRQAKWIKMANIYFFKYC